MYTHVHRMCVYAVHVHTHVCHVNKDFSVVTTYTNTRVPVTC